MSSKRLHRHTTKALALVVLLGCGNAAQAAIVLNTTALDLSGNAFTRFINYVNTAVANQPNVPYGFSAKEAAYAYRLTAVGAPNHNAYCQLAVSLVEDQVTQAEVRITGLQSNPNGPRPAIAGDSYLEVGPMLMDLSITYEWCSAFTTSTQRNRWAAYAEQALFNVWNHNSAGWGGVPATWTGWSVNDPGNNYHYSFLEATMAWALVDDYTTINTNWRNFLETQKFPPLQNYYAALVGGGSQEGTGYGTAQMRLFEIYRLWRDSTGVDLSTSSTHLNDTISYWIHATVPSKTHFAPIGDQSRNSMPELYDYHRNLILQARAMSTNPTQRDLASGWLNSIAIDEMTSGFNLVHDLLAAGSSNPTPSALQYHATGTGHFFARSDWTPSALWMSFVCGPYNQSHAHQDQGAFTLFGNDWLAVTENIFSHSGINQEPRVHNTLRFRHTGGDTRQWPNSTSSMSWNVQANGEVQINADLSPAYIYPNQTRYVNAWQRQLRFGNRSLRVIDQYNTAAGVETIFQINTPSLPTINGNVITAGNLTATVLQPANPVISIVNWNALDPAEYVNGGYKIEIRGGGAPTGNYEVVLSDASVLFGNGFE